MPGRIATNTKRLRAIIYSAAHTSVIFEETSSRESLIWSINTKRIRAGAVNVGDLDTRVKSRVSTAARIWTDHLETIQSTVVTECILVMYRCKDSIASVR